jgi:HK97 family phage prohead protease
MPWEIVADDAACPINEPFGVHKIGSGELVGCHVSESDAMAQVAALNIVDPQGDNGENESPMSEQESPYPLNARQAAQYEALESVAETFGKWDQTDGADGSHYVAESPFEGLMCSSCVFFEGGRGCELVAGDIDPAGICKLWIIPQALIPGQPSEGSDVPAPMRSVMTEQEYRRTENGFDVPTVEHRRLSNVELRMEGDEPVLEGYATVYEYPYDIAGGPSDGGFTEIIGRGAAAKSSQEADVRLLINHEGVPLARTKSQSLILTSDDIGLKVSARLDSSNPRVQELRSAMDRGDLDQMSLAFRVLRQDWMNSDRSGPGYDVRQITEMKLFDVSVVTYPANPATVAQMRSDEPATDSGRSLSLARRQAQADGIC